MVSPKNYGSTRLVVGAHYGMKDFLVQRVTAIILAVYTLVLAVGVLVMPGFTYEGWRGLFTFTVFMLPVGQILVTLAFIALAWHAWIGVRDIWMDYVRPVGIRLFLQVMTVLWLVASTVYFAQIIWRL